MGIMAVEAPLFLFNRVMFELSFIDEITKVAVALKTEVIPLFHKNGIITRSMRVMTAYTVTFNDHLMNTACVLRNEIFMAVIA